MEATVEPKRNGKATASETESKPKVSRPRTRRQPPLAYSSSETKEPAIKLSKVASKGVSFDRIQIGDLFALTDDGESLNMKVDKTCARPWKGDLFDARGLTVYVFLR